MSKTIRDEPIAVVGIGCRFPGASGVEQLWEVLREGRDTISEIPPDRFDTEAWLASEPREAGKIVSREGGIVNGIDLFDAEFFGLSAREASQMDPQQRILLEVAWEAFEDAGIVPARLAGGDSGVFIGMLTNDYEDLLFERHEELGVYGLVGGYRNAAAGRISYAFDLRGPNVVVDAACASSLLAIHLACESLRTGESSLAVAGGTNLILEPQPSIGFSQAGMLAADGRCKFGDARGDGFVRSDGAALVVLESLSAARAAGRRIYAVIRGGATNNDGVSSGYLMTPSVEGQVDVLRKAYSRAEVSPAEVAYVEAHGTGTSAGDPVELKALGQVLGERDLERSLEEGGAAPFEVGSIKTNLGHTEGAAGVAGLIKTALVLHHGEIPPSLHLQEPNPSIPWDELPLSIPTELHAWPEKSRRLAAVSSFGITGVNVHLVLSSEADLDLASGAASPGAASSGAASPDEMDIEPGAHLFTLSARSPQALQELTKATAERLDGRQTESLADLCYTSHLHRSHLEYRAAFPTTSLEDLRERLREYDEAEQDATVEQAPPVVFVFAGQGSQWRGMTRELYRTEPVFREALERCGEALSREVDWSLLEELASDESDAILERTDVVQPTLFAVQVALAALWRSWGVEPAAVIGQSMGEVAAAHVAGALSLEDAARVICRRSRLVLKASGRGSMASTELSLDQARSLLERYEGVSIAVGSGPSSTVLAGDPDALEQIGKELAEREIFFRFVQVDYASHSPQMDPLLPELGELLAEVRPQAGELPFFSTVRAERISGVELDADYWVRNLREPVLFGSTVENVLEAFPEPLAFLEVGPHPVVLGAVRQSVAHHGRESLLLPSLRRDEPEREMLLTSLGALYEAGVEVNGSALHLRGGRLVRMPLYPWQRERFWLNEKRTRTQRRADEHPLLGVRTRPAASPEGSFWQTEISVEEMPELADHRVRGIPALPAAAYLESALHCGRELFSLPAEHALVVEQASFENLLSFSEGVPETVQWTASRLRPGDVSSAGARLSAHQQIEDGPGLGWKLLASARVRVVPTGELDASGDAAIEASSIDTSSMESFSVDTFYEELRAGGLDYGPHYRGLTELRRGSGEASGTLRPPATGGPWLLRPELLDAALHLLFASLPAPHAGARPATWLPVFLGRLIFLGTPIAGEKIFARARLNSLPGKDDDALVGDVVLHRADGTCLARVEGMQMKRLDGRRGVESFFYQTVWREEELETDQAPAGRWLIFADTGGAGEELARFLDAAGASSTLLTELSEETLAEAAAQSWDGVVHLASLDLDSLPDDPAATAEAIERVRRRGVDPVVRWLQALDAASTDLPNLWIVTRGAWNDENFGAVDGESFAQAPVWGFGRTLPYELPDLVVRCVDLDPADDMATQSKRLAVELAGAAPYEQVVLRETRRVARPEPVRPAEKQEPVSLAVPTGPYRLVPAASGLLDDLRLQPIDLGSPGPHEARIEVRAAALNFHDVLDALGSLPFSARGDDIGLDFSGVVLEVGAEVTDLAPGDEVLGIAPQCIGSQVNARRELLLPKTAAWSFDQAASMPVVYLTAWYALCDRAQLRSGERVLIHAGTGGVGMAAIRIAQQIGAEIYATAGSEEKRDFLRSLGVEHVFDSRSLAFVDGILRQTEGAGVDVVLNSLAGECRASGLISYRYFKVIRFHGFACNIHQLGTQPNE